MRSCSNLVLSCLLCIYGLTGCASRETASGGQAASDLIDCNDELYMPAHLPEECTPPEQAPVTAEKPDPIVGTYMGYINDLARTRILRVWADGTAGSGYGRSSLTWKKIGDKYSFYYVSEDGEVREYPNWSTRYRDAAGLPNIISFGSKQQWRMFEANKLSDNPNHLFDHYTFSPSKDDRNTWVCVNVGQRQETYGALWQREDLKNFASTLAECQRLCEVAVPKVKPTAKCS